MRGWSTRTGGGGGPQFDLRRGQGDQKAAFLCASHPSLDQRDFLSFECGARDYRDRACLERWALDDDMRQSVSRADPLHFPPTLSRYLSALSPVDHSIGAIHSERRHLDAPTTARDSDVAT